MANKRRLKRRTGTAAARQQELYILTALFAAITGFIVVAAILSLTGGPPAEDVAGPQTSAPAEAGKGGMAKFVRVSPPRPLGAVGFDDGDGRPHTLSEWAGKVVLVNLWATWCAPCKEEMPGLGLLQAKLGGPDFAVVAISLDRGGADRPRQFLSRTAPALALYLDKSGKLMQALRAPGLPLTVLIDRQGREVARLAGAAPWDSPEAEAVIRDAISAKSNG
jgi:thiol-disulfide isomerase/thioredoxin